MPRSHPVHTDYHADYESADSFEGSVHATSLWWWLWIGMGVIAVFVHPLAIAGVVLAYPIVDRFFFRGWHNAISFVWRSRFSILLVLALGFMVLFSMFIHGSKESNQSRSSGSSSRDVRSSYYNPGISMTQIDSDKSTYLNPTPPSFDVPERVVSSSVDSCWNDFLNQRKGMKEWAEANPTLAAKERAKRC